MSVSGHRGDRVRGSLPDGYGLALAGDGDAAIQPLLDPHTGMSIADALHVREELQYLACEVGGVVDLQQHPLLRIALTPYSMLGTAAMAGTLDAGRDQDAPR